MSKQSPPSVPSAPPSISPSEVSIGLFLARRALSLAYLAAFVSLFLQVMQLAGPCGVAPSFGVTGGVIIRGACLLGALVATLNTANFMRNK